MDTYNRNSFNPIQEGPSSAEIAARSFMANVFSWMFGALLITAITAYCACCTTKIQLLATLQTFHLTNFHLKL